MPHGKLVFTGKVAPCSIPFFMGANILEGSWGH
jgi:hypothetical protein